MSNTANDPIVIDSDSDGGEDSIIDISLAGAGSKNDPLTFEDEPRASGGAVKPERILPRRPLITKPEPNSASSDNDVLGPSSRTRSRQKGKMRMISPSQPGESEEDELDGTNSVSAATGVASGPHIEQVHPPQTPPVSEGSDTSFHSARSQDGQADPLPLAEPMASTSGHDPYDPSASSTTRHGLVQVPAQPQQPQQPQQNLQSAQSLATDPAPAVPDANGPPGSVVARWAASVFTKLWDGFHELKGPGENLATISASSAQSHAFDHILRTVATRIASEVKPVDEAFTAVQMPTADAGPPAAPADLSRALQGIAACLSNSSGPQIEQALERSGLRARFASLDTTSRYWFHRMLMSAAQSVLAGSYPTAPAAQLVATTDGADTMSMAQLIGSDEDAVADMANLKPCSDKALEDLKRAGLRTPLKSHQSSGLKYLVDSEHRRLPQTPADDEQCLWRVRSAVGGTELVHRMQDWGEGKPSVPRGAILADAMGLGKTLTILALILVPRDGGKVVEPSLKDEESASSQASSSRISSPQQTHINTHKGKRKATNQGTAKPVKRAIFSDSDSDSDMHDDLWSSDDDGGSTSTKSPSGCQLPTLIICPMSVISNWTHQADTHTRNPSMRYAVLHGKDALTLKRQKNWSKYDFIITTYDWIKVAYRDIGLFEKCKENVEEHRQKLDTMRREVQELEHDVQQLGMERRKDRLERALSELADCEANEKDAFILCPRRNGQRVQDQHSDCRKRAAELAPREPDTFENYTEEELYFVWTGHHKKPSMEWRRVFDQQWLRIVLDEAHVIRNFGTQIHDSVRRLRAERKIAVTGTPIVNSTIDFGALCAFLGVQPFTGKQARSPWMGHIENAVRAREGRGMFLLRSLTKSLVILRTKEMKVNGAALVDLPPITMNRYEVDMKPDDMEYYRDCEAKLRQSILEWAENGEMAGKQCCVLVFLQRMRQLANDRRLVPKNMVEEIQNLALPDPSKADVSHSLGPQQVAALQAVLAANIENEEDCAICYDALSNGEDDGQAIVLYCGHCYHKNCITRSMELQPKCPYDQRPLKADTRMIELAEPATPESPDASETLTEPADSAKLDAVSEIVSSIIVTNPQDKIIIFSNFVGLLRLVAKRMETDGVVFATFYGCHSKIEREATLKSFGKEMPPPSAAQPQPTPSRPSQASLPAVTPASSNAGPDSSSTSKPRSTILERLALLEAADAFSPKKSDGHAGKGKGKSRIKPDHGNYSRDQVPQVCLMSMGAGSVGLNLTVASHVILIDPWWNEPLAAQAINRTHRIGQTKPVKVYRLVSKDTVEQRVVETASEKMELTTFALSGVKYKGTTLFKGHDLGKESRMGDLGSLFGMSKEELTRLRVAARRNNLFRR